MQDFIEVMLDFIEVVKRGGSSSPRQSSDSPAINGLWSGLLQKPD